MEVSIEKVKDAQKGFLALFYAFAIMNVVNLGVFILYFFVFTRDFLLYILLIALIGSALVSIFVYAVNNGKNFILNIISGGED